MESYWRGIEKIHMSNESMDKLSLIRSNTKVKKEGQMLMSMTDQLTLSLIRANPKTTNLTVLWVIAVIIALVIAIAQMKLMAKIEVDLQNLFSKD